MHLFEIVVQRRVAAGWPQVVEYSRPDTHFAPPRWDGLLTLDSTRLTELILAPHAYGACLGQALFAANPAVGAAFARGRAAAADAAPLQVRLVIEDDDARR